MRDPITGMIVGLSNLPPGVTDRDVDRAAGGDCRILETADCNCAECQEHKRLSFMTHGKCRLCDNRCMKNDDLCRECATYRIRTVDSLRADLLYRAVETIMAQDNADRIIAALRKLDEDAGLEVY